MRICVTTRRGVAAVGLIVIPYTIVLICIVPYALVWCCWKDVLIGEAGY